MNEIHGNAGGRRRTRAGGATLGALALLGALATTGCSSPAPEDDRIFEQEKWAEGITPAWMSEHMRIDVPAQAKDVRAGYQITSQYDIGVLTFTLTRRQAQAFLKKYPPTGKLLEPTAAATDVATTDFRHLGVPEPESFKEGMRYGDICPGYTPTENDPNSDDHCFELSVHDYAPDRTRVYLREHYEPGISPLPTPTSSEK
ncbi:hypothetical protein AB0K93_02870 [Streptomyces sp. NPDC052676]|uniref:hypothetical protein n=1 Tax=Streptomyces sp. NPDC052676 TaxID=3154953 RepID=UPI0034461D9F